ncbi:RES family NAD+ phosphorylase [Salmonella enterica subsp. enterica]
MDEKYICHHCVGDNYVRLQIRKTGNTEQKCSYCERKRRNLPLEYIACLMNDVFDYYYDCYEDIYDTGRGDIAQDVICHELGVEYEMAEDIYSCLADNYNPYNDYEGEKYNDDFVYRERNYSSGELDDTWGNVTKSLLSKTRFFNRDVNDFLDSLFMDIDKFRTRNKVSPIWLLNESDLLFRARVFEDQKEVEKALEQPERNFGPPPSSLARSGRMNAQGISVFYGATSVEVAIAEVRPPVGSIVITAPFVPLGPLHVLNISALDALSFGTGSKFDPQTRKSDERAIFFKTLSRKLTLPVFGKRQDSDYLITQVVADYLSDQNKFNLDGVSFKSTQVSADKISNGYNVVLFNRSSSVRHGQEKKRRYKVELYEHIEEDLYALSPTIQLIEDDLKKHTYMRSFSSKEYMLRLETSGMAYHKITGVRYDTKETAIHQGESIVTSPPSEPFDELTDF